MSAGPPKTADELREAFLAYFETHDHLRMPSSSLIPASDPTLLLTNSGMAQFKSYFSGEKEPPHPRITTSQKCFRTTDIEEVGDDTHLTMFEMLGNFSFGNYFKKDACAWALDLLTNQLGLDPERLYFTVYTTDDEAEHIWSELGIPNERIYRFGDEDNWWGPAGNEGVCGPSSEINYYKGSLEDVPEADDPIRNGQWGPNYHEDFIELYNLVFTQFYRDLEGNDTVLPAKNIDTGMGFERMLAVLQGVDNVYDTDAFSSIIAHVETLSGKKWNSDQDTDRAIRVVAEHARSSCFLIGDGVIPGNTGRGYVLRRLIRRAMLFGRDLGLQTSILSSLTKTVCDQMSHVYPELSDNYDFIKNVLEQEENSFSRTLEFGALVLSGMIDYRFENPDAARDAKKGKQPKPPTSDEAHAIGRRQAISEIQRLVESNDTGKVDQWQARISGKEAFVLYDTYGYPLEVTEEVAGKAGISVDADGFAYEMEKQRERGRAVGAFGGDADSTRIYEDIGIEDTPFVGYEALTADTTISAIVVDGASVESAELNDNVELVLDETPFYAARGGQVGDTGIISNKNCEIQITDTRAPYGHINVHFGTVMSGSVYKGDEINAAVDEDRRERIRRNHTATHLVHAALREIVGSHVRQAGSVVDPDRLRFDFTHMEALSREQIRAVQNRVNEKIRLNREVEVHWTTYGDAVAEGALAFFGDTYENEVRTIKIDAPWSYELCGGTHMDQTGGIGTFVIMSETGIGSGMRRMEAITGIAAEQEILDRFNTLEDIATKFRVGVSEAPSRIGATLDDLTQSRKRVEQLEQQLIQASVGSGTTNSTTTRVDINSNDTTIRVEIGQVPASNVEALRKAGDHLKNQIRDGVVVLGSVIGERPIIIVMATQNMVKAGIHSGNIAQEIAKRIDGGGGGSPIVAQAGGKDADQLKAALESTEEIIKKSLN